MSKVFIYFSFLLFFILLQNHYMFLTNSEYCWFILSTIFMNEENNEKRKDDGKTAYHLKQRIISTDLSLTVTSFALCYISITVIAGQKIFNNPNSEKRLFNTKTGRRKMIGTVRQDKYNKN